MYLHEDKEQFRQAVNMTAFQFGVIENIVEKDYYVTMILRLLSERMPYAVFKGGTSLSKCHKAILRFSEDIDIAVDTSLSQGQKKKLKYIIVDIAQKLGLQILNLDETRSRRDYNRYVMAYDSVLAHTDDAIQSAVLLETSFTAVSFPTDYLNVGSMIGDMMRQEVPEMLEKFYMNPFEMKVQGMDRTLVDKVFAICDYYLQNRVKKHSRHIYDIYKLLPLVPQEESFKKLVREVRVVRKQSDICLSAQEGVEVPDLLNEIINGEIYRDDYQDITMRLLDENVDYDVAIKALSDIARSGMFVS